VLVLCGIEVLKKLLICVTSFIPENNSVMEGSYSFSSYHNGGPGREKDFQKLAQTIGTSIQKISQNGKPLTCTMFVYSLSFQYCYKSWLK
jgi:hypothetical protein